MSLSNQLITTLNNTNQLNTNQLNTNQLMTSLNNTTHLMPTSNFNQLNNALSKTAVRADTMDLFIKQPSTNVEYRTLWSFNSKDYMIQMLIFIIFILLLIIIMILIKKNGWSSDYKIDYFTTKSLKKISSKPLIKMSSNKPLIKMSSNKPLIKMSSNKPLIKLSASKSVDQSINRSINKSINIKPSIKLLEFDNKKLSSNN